MSNWREESKIKLAKLALEKKRLMEMAQRLYEEGLLWSGEKAMLDESAKRIEKDIFELEVAIAVEDWLLSEGSFPEYLDLLSKPDDDLSDV